MAETRSTLENRIHALAPLMREPAAPGADPAAGKDGADGMGVVSLLYPSPDIAGDSRKWGIAQKNILTQLEEQVWDGREDSVNARATQKLRAWVEKMEPDDLPEGGFALFTDGDELSVHSLTLRPHPTLHTGEIFALPALVDAAQALRYWCVALDAEHPRLFYVSGGTWTDETPKDVLTLTGEMAQTHPMATVTFHSSGRPHIGSAGHAAAKFHSLGRAPGDVKHDEIERVFESFAKQVKDKVSGTKEPVLIVGDPRNCGFFDAHFDHDGVVQDDLHAGGDALELRELAHRAKDAMQAWHGERTREELGDLDRHTLRSNEQELLGAAREGRIAHVFLREDAAGILTGDDERLKLDAVDDQGAEARSMIVATAVKNGAGLTVFTEEMASDLPLVSATMRY